MNKIIMVVWIKMSKFKCDTCWDEGKMCVGLTDDLSPILEDCRDCRRKPMEAKDTVIKLCNHPYHNKQCHADQAEISFKAGEMEEARKVVEGGLTYNDGKKAGKSQGIKEVVEWIEEQGEETFRTGYYPSHKMWQAFKKERGL